MSKCHVKLNLVSHSLHDPDLANMGICVKASERKKHILFYFFKFYYSFWNAAVCMMHGDEVTLLFLAMWY